MTKIFLLALVDYDEFNPIACYETEEEANKAAKRFKMSSLTEGPEIFEIPFYEKVKENVS